MDNFSVILSNTPRPAVLLLGLALGCVAWATSKRSSIRLLPSPSGASWVWGHEKLVQMNAPGRAFRNWMSELGLTFRIKAAFGAPDILVLADPVGIAHVLQKKIYDYHHSAVVRPRVARLLGRGLGWIEGESEHKRMRRLAKPALTTDNIREMYQDITDSAMRVINDLVSSVQTHHNKEEVNIVDWTGKATLNIVGRVAFLHDFEAGNSEEAQRILNARKAGVSPAAKYIGFLMLMLLRRFTFLNYLPIFAIQSQGLAKETVHAGVAKELIEREKNKRPEKDNKDLLSRLVAAAAEEKISVQEFYEHISTFIIAGFESTTTTAGFAIWELARQPEKQKRLRDELLAFNGHISFNDLQYNTPYLDAVLKESLRLYPGLAYMERVAMKPDVIPLREPVKLSNGQMASEVYVEPGQTVIIPIISIQRNAGVWTDPDVFRPERWLEGEKEHEGFPSSEELHSGWASILAFSDGPRSCIGAQLAIYNFKVIMTNLATRFSFEDAGNDLSLKVASSLQAWVGKSGTNEPLRNELPVVLNLLDDY